MRATLAGMKASKCCPKCESRDVGYYVNLPNSSDSLKFGKLVLSERWACTSCGLVEEYVSVPDKLSTLDGFNMVKPSPASEGPFR